MLHQKMLLDRILRLDRATVSVGLLTISVLSWAYLVYLARNMSTMMIPVNQIWQPGDFIFQFVMWVVMMGAMMLPTAAPMILMFTKVQRKRTEHEGPYLPTTVFTAGYVIVWSGIAAAATVGQWGLHSATLLSPMMQSTNAVLGGTLLLVAGLFQLSPLKRACLAHCRSPLGFIITEWREGIWGNLHMGFKHGFYCVGCCWVLMTLLFVIGVKNLLWMALLSGFVLLEKVAPRSQWVSWVSASVLVTLAGWIFTVTFI